ncbi:hypothetical protein C0993_006596, partial [Termitomyces sp. T159_Od127]
MAFSNLQTPPQKSEELALDTSNLILTTLVNAAKITNVPILQGAAASALNIVEIAQKVRSNKKAFKRLANDSCALVYIVLRNDSKLQSNISIQESLASISDLLAPRKYVKTDQSDEVTPTRDRFEEAHINEDQIVEARGPGNK